MHPQEKEVDPQALAHDREEKFNVPLFRRLGELGLLGVTVPGNMLNVCRCEELELTADVDIRAFLHGCPRRTHCAFTVPSFSSFPPCEDH